MKLNIDPSERWIVLGKTGSGKSEFAKHLLRQVSQKMPVVIVDPKEYWLGKHPVWAARKEPGTIDKPHLVNKFNPKWRVQILQPDEEDDDRLARMCHDVLKAGNIFIYFDETEGIATANSVPFYLRRIWKTGRALGVGAWVSSQAPTGIPKIFKSQAEKFITFRVGDEDIDLVSSLVHSDKEELRDLGKYEWLYYDTEQQHAEWNPPIPFKPRRAANASRAA